MQQGEKAAKDAYRQVEELTGESERLRKRVELVTDANEELVRANGT